METQDRTSSSPRTGAAHKLPVNVDFLAIGIALALAALIRLGVIHQVGF